MYVCNIIIFILVFLFTIIGSYSCLAFIISISKDYRCAGIGERICLFIIQCITVLFLIVMALGPFYIVYGDSQVDKQEEHVIIEE